MKLLCTAPPSDVFAICDAINDLGGLAVAPRYVRVKRERGKPDEILETPRWPGYLFLSIAEAIWHGIERGMPNGTKRLKRPRMLRQIGDAQWQRVQIICEEAEQDYQYDMAMIEAQLYEGKRRLKLKKRARGDLIELLDGPFAGQAARVVSDDGQALRYVVEGVTLMGREVEGQMDPINAKDWAAE